MSELPWFRFYPEILNDPKISVIAREMQYEPITVLGIWTYILCLAAKSPHRGTLSLSDKYNYTVEDIAQVLNWNPGDIQYLMNAFITMNMIYIRDDGAYVIKNWDKRQFTKEDEQRRADNAERQRRYREIHKNSNASNALYNALVTPPDTDTDTESYTDINDDDNVTITKTSYIFQLYEQNIGLVPPLLVPELQAAEKEFPKQWLQEAFIEGVNHNARNWKYIHKCLVNRKDGYSPGKNGNRSLTKEQQRVTAAGRERYGEYEK